MFTAKPFFLTIIFGDYVAGESLLGETPILHGQIHFKHIKLFFLPMFGIKMILFQPSLQESKTIESGVKSDSHILQT